MLTEALLPYLRSVSPRPLPHSRLFLNILKIKHDQILKRGTVAFSPGYGTRRLLELLEIADLEQRLVSQDTLLLLRHQLESHIDVRAQRHHPTALFIQSPRPCLEILVPARSKNPIADIPSPQVPFQSPLWDAVRPLRMVDIANGDLRFQIQRDKILYPKHAPSYAMYTIDVFALLSKYFAYCKSHPIERTIVDHRLQFLHYCVVLPALVEDQVALWLRNLYADVFLHDTPLSKHVETVWDGQHLEDIAGEFPAMIAELRHLKADLSAHTLSPQALLGSLPLSLQGQSFSSYYCQLIQTTIIPTDQNVTWVECIKQLRWLEIIVILLSLEGDTPESLTVRRAIVRVLRLWKMLKPWQELHLASPHRILLQVRLEGMLTYLQQG